MSDSYRLFATVATLHEKQTTSLASAIYRNTYARTLKTVRANAVHIPLISITALNVQNVHLLPALKSTVHANFLTFTLFLQFTKQRSDQRRVLNVIVFS